MGLHIFAEIDCFCQKSGWKSWSRLPKRSGVSLGQKPMLLNQVVAQHVTQECQSKAQSYYWVNSVLVLGVGLVMKSTRISSSKKVTQHTRELPSTPSIQLPE